MKNITIVCILTFISCYILMLISDGITIEEKNTSTDIQNSEKVFWQEFNNYHAQKYIKSDEKMKEDQEKLNDFNLGKMIDKLLPYIAMIESSNNVNAIGDFNNKKHTKEYILSLINNKDIEKLKKIDPALGIHQIHWRYWQDGIEYLKLNWSYLDVINIYNSEKVVYGYLMRYGKRCRNKKGDITYKDLALIHNGGPNGYKYEKNPYWNKIEAAMGFTR